MTNIDFHILEDADEHQSLTYACELIEKAHANHETVYIHTQSPDAAEFMDNLLWSYRDDAFLPHHLYDPAETEPPPIQIGFGESQPTQDVLVNLSNHIPACYREYKRVIEIVFANPVVQESGRERYRQYRQHGSHIHTHKIKVNAS